MIKFLISMIFYFIILKQVDLTDNPLRYTEIINENKKYLFKKNKTVGQKKIK